MASRIRNIRGLLSLIVFVSSFATSCYRYETRQFEITIPEQAESSVVVSNNGTLITTLVAPENRTSARRLDEIPEMVRNAVLAIEDERFYEHDGFDIKAIIRAARSNLEAGGISQGGSTITQQYVKLAIIENLEQTASRKLEELWYATRLEDQYGKDFILLQYLNTVYFGHGAYGIKAAALSYFNKNVTELKIAEAAMLAGLLKAPSRYDPFRDYTAGLKRSHLVLDRMLANEFITREEHTVALASPPQLEEYEARLETTYPAGHFVEEVRRWFLNNPVFGANRSLREMLLYEGGLRIETTIDLTLQERSEQTIETYMPSNQGHPDAAVVVMNPQTGHVLAMVGGRDFFANDEDAKVNLTMGNGRQAGSSFKPIALAAALESGWEPTAIYKAPNVVEFFIPGTDEENRVWRVSGGVNGHDAPEPRFEKGAKATFQYLMREGNLEAPSDHVEVIAYQDKPDDDLEYVGVRIAEWINNRRWEYKQNTLFDYRIEILESFPGWSWEPTDKQLLKAPPPVPEVDLIKATRRSYNTVFAQLSMQLGAQRVTNMARRLGVQSPVQPVNSNVLGTSDVTLLDMAAAYSTFANRGVSIPPAMVTRVSRSDGKTLWTWKRNQERALDTKTVDQLTWILEGTITEGTGHRAQIDRPAAGKTGTTQNYADALFVGYTPQRAAAVWVGFPQGQIPMVPPTTERKVYGGTYPALIWQEVMTAAHEQIPITNFASPPPSSTTTTTKPPAEAIPTPELLGLTIENAQNLLNQINNGIEITTVVEVEISGTEPGTIIGQSPNLGTALRPGDSILVEIAIEPKLVEKVRIPEVSGQLLSDTSQLIVAEGLGYETTIVSDPDDPNRLTGVIWRQDPPAGTLVEPGTVISLKVTP